MLDTSEQAQRRYYELLRAQAPVTRLATAVRLSSVVRELAEAGVRSADPQASPQVVKARVVSRLYGREAACRLFPGVNWDV